MRRTERLNEQAETIGLKIEKFAHEGKAHYRLCEDGDEIGVFDSVDALEAKLNELTEGPEADEGFDDMRPDLDQAGKGLE